MTISELIEMLELRRSEVGEDADTNIHVVVWNLDGTLFVGQDYE